MPTLISPIRALAEWVDALPSSIAFRESFYVSPYTTVTHVVSMAAFAGLIVMMDLRLLGVANRGVPFSVLQRRLFPWQMLAMGVAAASGLLLLFGDPLRLYVSIFFWTKICMMAIAGLNALAFHYLTYESVPAWDTAVPPAAARMTGAISLTLWAAVIVAGRLIPYGSSWFPAR